MKSRYVFFLILCSYLLSAETAYNGKIDSAVSWENNKIYLFYNHQYQSFNFNINRFDRGYPKNIYNELLSRKEFKTIEAVFIYGPGIICIISNGKYLLYNRKTKGFLQKEPEKFNSETWPGMTFTSVDGAFNNGRGKIYFFKGNRYIRFDIVRNKADKGYPKMINNATWPGLPFNEIDAVGYYNDKAYFFSGEKYARFDIPKDKTDSGYPRATLSGFKGLHFDSAANPGTILDESDQPVITVPDISASNNKLDFHIDTFKVKLGKHSIHYEQTVLGIVTLALLNNGNMAAAYQSKNNVVIHYLGKDFQSFKDPVVLKNYFLSDIYGLKDGSLVLLLGRDVNNTYISGYANTLYIVKLAPNGREIFKTSIFGGKGHGPGKSWFDGRSKARLAYNGQVFAVYMEVQKNWAEPGESQDIHNGDMYIEINSKGKLIESTKHFWTASHSSTIQLASGKDNKFYTMTIGDAYPYGLQFYDRKENKNWILWPPKEDYVPYEKVNSTNAAGILEAMIADGNDFIALLGTLEHPNIGVFDKVDVLFLKTNNKGKVKIKKWLVQSPSKDESVISAAPLGKNLVVAWGKGNDYDDDWNPGPVTLSLIDVKGNFIISSREKDLPWGTYSELVSDSPGYFYWTVADNGSNEFTLYRGRIK